MLTQLVVMTSTFSIRTALFWLNTQRVVVISYRRFGTAYWSHTLPYINTVLRQPALFWILEPWVLSRYVVPKLRYEITATCSVITQKSTILICCAAEAWNHVNCDISCPYCIRTQSWSQNPKQVWQNDGSTFARHMGQHGQTGGS